MFTKLLRVAQAIFRKGKAERDMDKELRDFKESGRVPGQDRIYVAGEIEFEKTQANRANGVPVHYKVWDGLQKLGGELGIPLQPKG